MTPGQAKDLNVHAIVVPTRLDIVSKLRWEIKHQVSKKKRTPLSKEQLQYKQDQVAAFVKAQKEKVKVSVRRIEAKVDKLPEATAKAVTSAMASTDNEPGLTPTEQIAADRLKVRFLNNRINKNREVQKEAVRVKQVALAEAKVKAAASKAATSAVQSPKKKAKKSAAPAEEVEATPKKRAAAPAVEVAPTPEKKARKSTATLADVQEGVEDAAEAFKCPACKFVARSKRGLRTHQKRQGHYSEEDQEEEEEEEEEEAAATEAFKCPLCEFTGKTLRGLKQHQHKNNHFEVEQQGDSTESAEEPSKLAEDQAEPVEEVEADNKDSEGDQAEPVEEVEADSKDSEGDQAEPVEEVEADNKDSEGDQVEPVEEVEVDDKDSEGAKALDDDFIESVLKGLCGWKSPFIEKAQKEVDKVARDIAHTKKLEDEACKNFWQPHPIRKTQPKSCGKIVKSTTTSSFRSSRMLFLNSTLQRSIRDLLTRLQFQLCS